MKRLLLSCVCVMALSACATGHSTLGDKTHISAANSANQKQSAIDVANRMAAMPNTDMPMDPSVQTYNTSGPFSNPLVGDHTRSLLDNTTSGGYTVFDDSVTVYPLPGEQAPAFVPAYSVPPLKGQYDGTNEAAAKPQSQAQSGMVGTPIGLASAGDLPPVKNVDVASADPFAKPPVGGQVRRPLSLTAAEPVTLQPPVSATPAPRSPFAADGAPAPEAPSLSASSKPLMAEGRRSGPSLTGY